MTTISGIFTDPNDTPVSGVILSFKLLANSASSFVQRHAECVTGENGEYSITLSDGVYSVSAQYTAWKNVALGTISIDSSSIDGTLNSFLLVSGVEQPSAILSAVQATYQQMLNLQKTPVFTAATYADIPADAGGLYLVLDDETKGNTPAMYLFANSRTFWLAMVEITV